MNNINIPVLVNFIGYISIVLAVGFIATRVTKNLSDYVLGGRSLSGPIAALGAGASDMSGWLLMALPGAVYLHGINQIWMPIGLSLGAFLNWAFVAKRLRIYTEIAKDSLTIPAYFDNRFHDQKKILRAVTAVIVVIFFTGYSSAGFVAGAVLTQMAFHMSYMHALILTATVLVVYTCVGGFLAITWVDFFQGTLMFFALLIVPLATMKTNGGVLFTIDSIAKQNPSMATAFANIDNTELISLLAWGLGYFGQAHILVRFMATKSSRVIPLAQFICMTWMILALYGAVFTGFSGISYFSSRPLNQPETVFLLLAKELFNPWVEGFLLAAVLSATMSTVAAQLLTSSSALAEDFYHSLFRKKANQKELLWVGRLGVIIIAIAAFLLALDNDTTILKLVSFGWGGMGASFGPIVIMSLYWKRMTCKGAIAGMIMGAATALVWIALRHYYGGIFQIYEIVPGFIMNALAIVVVSLKDKKPEDAILQEFASMEQAVIDESI